MTKQNIFAIIIFIIILATSVMFVNIDKKNRIENYLQQQHKTINTQFNVIYDEKYQLSQIVYNELISNPNIIRIMNQTRKKNSEQSLKVLRNDLYSILNKKYIQWKLLGIQQLHFHLNDNKSFLRMHKPEKFGDDLSNIRESVKLVNQLKTTSHGFEMGRIISGFRFVFPIIADDGSHIGSVEASISTKNFKRELKQSFHSKINFIIKKTIVDKKAFSPVINKQYKTTPINKNFYANKIQQSNISKIPIKILEQIDNKLKKSKTFSVYFKYINGYKTITFYPIHNIKDNEIIAYFVKFNDSEYLTNLYKDFYIILTMLLALSLAIIIYIYNNNVYKSKLAQNIQMIHNQKEELTHTVHELEEQNIQIARQIEEGRKKDTLIAEQSRLASLGEMIGNIAHQWRQPLSAISTSASSL
ncbi:MAG: hypothetical protein KAJ49_10080, partial [Arcobacteraceae bacterium]|nr:hypothetical protein [Arcobacteraceae bacterium]